MPRPISNELFRGLERLGAPVQARDQVGDRDVQEARRRDRRAPSAAPAASRPARNIPRARRPAWRRRRTRCSANARLRAKPECTSTAKSPTCCGTACATIATVVATPSDVPARNDAAMTTPSQKLWTLVPMRIMSPERPWSIPSRVQRMLVLRLVGRRPRARRGRARAARARASPAAKNASRPASTVAITDAVLPVSSACGRSSRNTAPRSAPTANDTMRRDPRSMEHERARGGDRREYAAGKRGDDDLHESGQDGRAKQLRAARMRRRCRAALYASQRRGSLRGEERVRYPSAVASHTQRRHPARVALAAIREEARRVVVRAITAAARRARTPLRARRARASP